MTPRRLIEPARLAGSALLHTQSDERLVDLARAGNDRAFEAIVTRYRRPLLRFCRRLLPAERAEDAVQQTFLNAYRAIGSGEGDLNLRPWLYRIAHNASLSLLRQNGWSHEELDDQFDGVPQPPQEVELSERLNEVMRAVRDLPERQRDAVVLRELEGRSYEEIALALGVSGGAVRQLLNRARANLRAAATAVTPLPLAELCAGGAAAGAGGLAVATKLGTALVVAGAVAGGTTGAGPLPDVVGGGSDGAGDQAVAAQSAGPSGADARPSGEAHGPGDGKRDRDDDRRDRAGAAAEEDRDSRDDSDGNGSDEDDDDSSGSGSGSDSDSSGPGSGDDDDGDSSGSGSSGSGSDSSGSGSGGDDGDSSGSGSGSSGSGSGSSGSGSGSSGSGTSGSGSGSGTSGSGTSGSGSGSGTSGSGTSGSGSGSGSSSGSGTSGSGSSGSDDD